MLNLLSEHLDIWTAAPVTKANGGRGRVSAANRSPYGIKKLRELILELAVRGMLVAQDPNDEPASVLLERIAKEKTRLIKEGKVKKQNPLPEISEEEKPFELPPGWAYTRNGNLFGLRKGKNPKNLSEKNIGLPYLDIEALDRGNILKYTDDERCPRSTDEDILVVCDGSRSGLVLNGKNGVVGSTLAVIDTPKFVQCYVKLLFQEAFQRLNTSMKGAAIPHLDTKNLIVDVIGLPPQNEQRRIIAKVDELMAFCDRLEQQQVYSSATHKTLVETLLATLTTAADHQGFAESWQRIAAHFDTLFTTEESIDQLKQTILQLAVQGKLVPQDPNDEPASVLLGRIAKEKARLIKEGKIKKGNPLPPINEDEVPFELPSGWAWARFPEIGEFGRGKSKHRPRNDPSLYARGKYPMVQTGDVARADRIIKTYTALYNDKGLAQSRLWPEGTMCITIAANIADSGILGFEACFPDSVVGLIPSVEIEDSRYFEYFMRTAKENLMAFAPATAQKNINMGILETVYIPLPPNEEIKRIVVKVDELMALCDQLKAKFTQSQEQSEKLIDAMFQQSLVA